jgi:hypothetical protein
VQVNTLRTLRQSDKFDVFDFEYAHILGAFSPPNRWAAFSGHPPFFADVKVPSHVWALVPKVARKLTKNWLLSFYYYYYFQYEGNPYQEWEADAFRNVEYDQGDVWMWDYFKNRGYTTFSARDFCSEKATFVYGDYISRPWTDVHWQNMFCELDVKLIETSAGQPRYVKVIMRLFITVFC